MSLLFSQIDKSADNNTRENGISHEESILLTKIAAAQNEVALSYHRVRGLYFLAVIFATTIFMVLHLY